MATMRLARTALIGLLVGATVLSAVPASAQEAVNTVTVEARKVVDVEADIGIAHFGIRTKAIKAQDATLALKQRIASVLDSMKDAGFTTDELATGGIQLYKDCIRRCVDPNPKDNIPPDRVMGYVGTATVTLETQQLNQLGRGIDAAIAGGADSIRGVSFDVENKDAAVLEALRQAMQLAKAKAQVIAEEADRTLGPALVVEEGRTSAPRRYDVLAETISGSAVSGAGGADAAIPFPVDPPTLNASARVEVTWELI